MEVDITLLFSAIVEGLQRFLAGSFFFVALKFFLFVYAGVLLADIILLFMLRGFSSDLKASFFGASRPLMTRSSAIKRWENILAHLESENPSQFKVAILEADAMADEVLGDIGFDGPTMGDKLQAVKNGQLDNKEALAGAHAIRNRIVHEEDFVVSREDAQEKLDLYKKFFDEVELF